MGCSNHRGSSHAWLHYLSNGGRGGRGQGWAGGSWPDDSLIKFHCWPHGQRQHQRIELLSLQADESWWFWIHSKPALCWFDMDLIHIWAGLTLRTAGQLEIRVGYLFNSMLVGEAEICHIMPRLSLSSYKFDSGQYFPIPPNLSLPHLPHFTLNCPV